LQRRTDFFYEMAPGEKMGFPPGVADQMVYQHLQKWRQVHEQKHPSDPKLEKKWKEFEEQRKVAEAAAKEKAEKAAAEAKEGKSEETSAEPEAKVQEVTSAEAEKLQTEETKSEP
jgi:type IV secretory pathway TraG/TraD family ATPase VirD4